MMEFSGDDVITILKQRVGELSLEVEMYRRYCAQLERQIAESKQQDDDEVTMVPDAT